MSLKLQLVLILSSVVFLGIIVNLLRKEMLDLRYSLTWISCGVAMVILAIRPQIAVALARAVGIVEPVNAIFLVAIIFAIFVSFSLTIVSSRQSIRIRKLAQEIALLEKALRSTSEAQQDRVLTKQH